jgi:probable HAF family extracellular repeat protein
VNASGQIVGWLVNRDGRGQALLWQADGSLSQQPDLGSPPDSSARAINDAGQIVGISVAQYSGRAVLWQHGAVYDLNEVIPPGSNLFLTSANDISNGAGCSTITGVGYTPSGKPHGFLLVPSDDDGDGLGADPHHKDIFLEIDYMECAEGCTPAHDHRPSAQARAAASGRRTTSSSRWRR